MRWELLLHGGRVLDPASGRDGPADVAVRAGQVDAVAPCLPVGEAAEAVDVTGRLVTPGLVDLHTHTWHGATTWVDAGSAGAYSLDGFRRFVIDAVAVRIPALLNVSALGLVGETGEHTILNNLDVDLAARIAARHADAIYGVKARIDARTVGAHGVEPLRRAVTLARRIERPLMVHVGSGPLHIADIAPLLADGDILTHCASGRADDILDGKGELSDPARRALDAGVTFDLGHGAGGFAFEVLEAQLAAGVVPTVSSDLQARSVHGPAFDLPTVMAKLLALGVPLPRVVEAATVRPTRALGLPDGAGTLAVGAAADVAVFDLENRPFLVADVHGSTREAPRRLTNVGIYVAGRRLPPRSPGPRRRGYRSPRHSGTPSRTAFPLPRLARKECRELATDVAANGNGGRRPACRPVRATGDRAGAGA